MRILLVDDDVLLRDMYATKFIEHGDEVAIAATGSDALRQVTENVFDVVVTDLVMPGMTGIELVQEIMQSATTQKPRCIILSNQSEETDRQSATSAGAAGYIVKAEHVPSEVVQRVHQLIKI